VKILVEEFNQESRTKGEEQKEVEPLLNQGMIEFFQDSRNRKDLCIGIEGDLKEVGLSQGIPKEELLKILVGEASFKCKS
jgi:hypothetical protein